MLAHDLRLALDPVKFAERLSFEPDPWQRRALTWAGRRLLLNWSRQSGKSTTAGLLAVHRALYWPGSLILLVSPSLRQSSELFRKVGKWLGQLTVKPELLEYNKLSCTLASGSRIVSLPSNEATIRGFSGASLIIEDEASRVSDELYKAVRPMLAVSGGRLILMSTPFGKRGHFFEEWSNGGEAWERIEIPAAMCPRIPQAFLEEERRSLGEYWYAQEYNCRFMETIDTVFSYADVIGALSSEVKPLFTTVAARSGESLADSVVATNIKPLLGV